MNESASYLVDSLVNEREKKLDNIYNRRNFIDLDNFFKETDKIEIKGKFVSACKFPMPIPERVLIKNDMSKYKLNKTLTEEYINRYERNKTKA
jgi:hypothetical protein